MSEPRYKILLAQFVNRTGRRIAIPYGTGFGVNDIEAYRSKFLRESKGSELRLTYEEKIQ